MPCFDNESNIGRGVVVWFLVWWQTLQKKRAKKQREKCQRRFESPFLWQRRKTNVAWPWWLATLTAQLPGRSSTGDVRQAAAGTLGDASLQSGHGRGGLPDGAQRTGHQSKRKPTANVAKRRRRGGPTRRLVMTILSRPSVQVMIDIESGVDWRSRRSGLSGAGDGHRIASVRWRLK